MDVVFINPSIENNYQSLGKTYAAIEPPTWSLLLAQSMRSFGYKVSIIDNKGRIKSIPKNKKSYIANTIAKIILDKLLMNDKNIN